MHSGDTHTRRCSSAPPRSWLSRSIVSFESREGTCFECDASARMTRESVCSDALIAIASCCRLPTVSDFLRRSEPARSTFTAPFTARSTTTIRPPPTTARAPGERGAPVTARVPGEAEARRGAALGEAHAPGEARAPGEALGEARAAEGRDAFGEAASTACAEGSGS